MAQNKTTQTENSVTDFINQVADDAKRTDCFRLIDLIRHTTDLEPRMWGPSIVGFGSYHYTYDSGHKGDAPLVGFSPRKSALTLYLAQSFDQKEALLQQFGKHKAAVGCIYIKKLSDINTDVLQEMVRASVAFLRSKYPDNEAL